MQRKFLLGATMGLACASLLAQPPFLRKDFSVGDRPQGIIIGDFNGDSRPDLAARSWSCSLPSGCGTSTPVFSIISVLLNTGGGNFTAPVNTRVQLNVPHFPRVAADFDGDGRLDLVGTDGGNSVHLLPGRGDGSFLQPREIATGVAFIAGSGDFNGDRIPDLLFVRQTGGAPPPQPVLPSASLEVQLGNGAGVFHVASKIDRLPPDANPNSAHVADFDGDGRSDLSLLMQSTSENTLAVFFSQANGTFGAPLYTIIGSSDWVLADFNRDGRADIATGTGVLIGKGDGTFQPERPYPSPGAPRTAADFTGDQLLDLVFASSGGFSVLQGRGDGTFLPPAHFRTPWPGGEAADLDGDRRADLYMTIDNAVSVLLLRGPDEPALWRALSAASGRATVAPGSLASFYAPTPVTATARAVATPWPTQLGGIGVEIRDSAGFTFLAPLLFVSPAQINFLVPATVALGEAALAIVSDRGATPAGGMYVEHVAPALFIAFPPGDYEGFSTSLPIPAYSGVRVTANGVQAPLPVNECSRSGGGQRFFPIPLRPAGDAVYLSLYGTGFRGGNTANVTCAINGVQVPVEYAGPQGTPGLDQINVRLLPEVRGQPPAGPGFVTVTIDGMVANFAALYLN